MKIIHCADLHLDSRLQTHLSREKAKLRRDELLRNFERLAEYASENKVDVILISGDLFDRDTVSALAGNMVLSVIAAHPEIRFYYLRGNHDTGDCLGHMSEGRYASNNRSDYMRKDSRELNRSDHMREDSRKLNRSDYMREDSRKLNRSDHMREGSRELNRSDYMREGSRELNRSGRMPEGRQAGDGFRDACSPGDIEAGLPGNLFLFGSRWKTYHEGKRGSVAIAGIELTKENSASAHSSLRLDPEQFNIVMLHGQPDSGKGPETERNSGHLTGSAHSGGSGNAGTISLRALRGKGIDYLALGHIHSWKKGRLDSRGIFCYPGCLEGRGFDECGERGFALFEIDEMNRIKDHHFIPFAQRTLYTVEADVTGCRTTAEMTGIIREMIRREGCAARDMADVVLFGELDVDCEKDTAYMEAELSERFFFARLRDRTTLRINLADYLHDESLRGEFVRRVMEDESVPEAEKIEVIRIGFMAMGGEELL